MELEKASRAIDKRCQREERDSKKLEDLLKRQIDLIEERAIKNRIFKQQLDISTVKIYEY